MSILTRIKNWLSRHPGSGSHQYFQDSANWTSVTSSNIAAIAYFIDVSHTGARHGVLGVRFTNRTWYSHGDVPMSVWVDFLAAKSRGKFHWAFIRDKYITAGPFTW